MRIYWTAARETSPNEEPARGGGDASFEIALVEEPEAKKKGGKRQTQNERLQRMSEEFASKQDALAYDESTSPSGGWSAPTPAKAKPASEAKPKKEPKPNRAWPAAFMSKALVKERIRSDAQFKTECVKIMGVRTGMRAADPSLKSCGFMSSHMGKGTECVRTLSEGRELSADQWKWLAGALPQYATQLASHFREAAIEADPSLKAIARTYGLKEAK